MNMKTILHSLAAGAGTLFLADAALAADVVKELNTGDTAWMLTSTALVLLMTIPGVALFYGGMVRKMNVLSVVMQSFAITCLISILWFVYGYSLAFKGDGAYIGNLSAFLLKGVDLEAIADLAPTIPETVFFVFQMTFAIITVALITGAVVDRMKFSSLLVFSALWLTFVYVPVAHWVWGGGFIGGAGVLDFAGGTVVHINAGIAGLVACIVVGKRQGYGSSNMAPHNLVLSVIGASLLWVGWFGFNAGSAVAASANAGMAMLVTQVATAAAALAWMFMEWMVRGKPSILGIVSGAVAGLVAITPASGFVSGGSALVIGVASGIICFFAATSIKNALKYDDSLDVFGVHGVGGIIGAILTGFFADPAIGGAEEKAGLFFGNAAQVGLQVYGVVVTIVFCAVVSFILLKITSAVTGGLRVDEEVERDGLDFGLHGETVH